MEEYTDLNNFVRTYRVRSEWSADNKSPEDELKTLKERLSNVPVFVRDFERKCKRHKRKCRCNKNFYGFGDLESMAEMSDSDRWLLDDSGLDEELDIIADRIVHPHPIIYLNGEDLEKGFRKKYPLDKVILPIGAVRVVKHPKEINAVCILFERDKGIQYIDIVMVDRRL